MMFIIRVFIVFYRLSCPNLYIPDAIRFYFEHLAQDTPAEGAILDFDLAAEPNRIALNSLEIEAVDNESAADSLITRQRLTITGLVRGVGFRPFVHTLAQQTRVGGWVQNTAFGVELEV